MPPQPTTTQEVLSAFLSIWHLWVPLLLLLIVMGWVNRRYVGGKLLLISLVALTAFTTKVFFRERAIARENLAAWNRMLMPLPAPSTIDGLHLAAGTMVRWNPASRGHLYTADLGAGQEVLPGIVLRGEAAFDDFSVTGFLVTPTLIRGWKCAKGKIDFHLSGELRWCLLSDDQSTPAGVVPSGTAVLLDPGDSSTVLLHLKGSGMRVNPGGFWIPSDEWFSLYADSELLSVPGPLTIRSVSFPDGIRLRYENDDPTRWWGYLPPPPPIARPDGAVTGWRGELGAPLICEGGVSLDKNSIVTIPVTGNVVTFIREEWVGGNDPHWKRVMESIHCPLPES